MSQVELITFSLKLVPFSQTVLALFMAIAKYCPFKPELFFSYLTIATALHHAYLLLQALQYYPSAVSHTNLAGPTSTFDKTIIEIFIKCTTSQITPLITIHQ